MNGKMQSYVLISPFFVALCAVIYVGYVQYLRTNDVTYSTFKGAYSAADVAIVKNKSGFSHRKKLSMKKDYIFNAIGKNLSQAFYDDLCSELPAAAFSKRKMYDISVNTYYKNTHKNMNLTPLMYAASVGNKAAIAALLNSGKSHMRALSIINEKIDCPQKGYFWTNKYKYQTTHTPFSIAKENGYSAAAALIKEAAEKNGYDDYTGVFYSSEKK